MLHGFAALLMAVGLAAGPAAAATHAGAPATAATQVAPAAVSPEMRQLEGKRVRIYYEVNLLGGQKPSPLHTEYLVSLLKQAGVGVVHITGGGDDPLDDPFNVKKPDIIILGDMPPPPQ